MSLYVWYPHPEGAVLLRTLGSFRKLLRVLCTRAAKIFKPVRCSVDQCGCHVFWRVCPGLWAAPPQRREGARCVTRMVHPLNCFTFRASPDMSRRGTISAANRSGQRLITKFNTFQGIKSRNLYIFALLFLIPCKLMMCLSLGGGACSTSWRSLVRRSPYGRMSRIT